VHVLRLNGSAFISLPIAQLPQGAYTLVVDGLDGKRTTRFIKQ
jgi:hypothetical protein